MTAGATTSQAPVAPEGAARIAMIVTLLASNLLASFMQSMMNVALDHVATQFSITLSQANWMVLGYTIVTATVITTAAALLDRYGLRKVMGAGCAFALVGSVLGYFAWNYPVMIVARLLQAVMTGLCFPLINEALLMISPKGKAGTLLSVNSGVIGVGLAFAPPLAGLVITYVGLRSLFLVSAIYAVVLLLVGHFTMHNLFPRRDTPIDIPSVLLSFAGLACLMYGLNEIAHELFPPLAIMLVGVVIIGAFVWRQKHIATPLLNLTPLKNKVFTVGEILVALAYMASVYMSLLVPLYLEGVASYSTFIAGCLCTVPILCYAACCFPSGHIFERHGVSPLVPIGFAIVLAGYIGMFFTASHMIVIAFLVCSALAYAGIGIFFPALKSNDLESLQKQLSSHGSSIHSTIVQIGSSISSALFVGIMSGRVDFMVAHGVSKANAYSSAFSNTVVIEIGILVVAVVLAIVYTRLVRKRKASKLEQGAEQQPGSRPSGHAG